MKQKAINAIDSCFLPCKGLSLHMAGTKEQQTVILEQVEEFLLCTNEAVLLRVAGILLELRGENIECLTYATRSVKLTGKINALSLQSQPNTSEVS